MSTPTEHALLSASSAHRWLVCTAAPKFEEQFPDGTSTYAEEGTLAHHICELYATRAFKPQEMSSQKFGARLKKAKQNELYDEEMLSCAEGYVEYLKSKSLELYDSPPYITQEVKVDYSAYAPEGFGTCDCIMIGGNTLHITDYKHGKGVAVSAVANPQMMLYALGALEKFKALYSIKFISMGIYQPRISSEPSEWGITVEELLQWGENIKPLAQAAFTGKGATFCPGDHCRFCKGKAQCKARADKNTALEEFKDFALPNDMDAAGNTLTDAQIGDLLVRGADLVQWYDDLKAYATQALLEGKAIPGWKVVEGRSNRAISDMDALITTLKNEGYDEAMLYERKPLTITGYEKLCGKKKFGELAQSFIVKPQGKPTLAPESDKRQPFSSAATDFAGA